jgi:hypothetical protein
VRAADSAVKSDRATDLRNPGFGAWLLEGEGASEAGQWASSVRPGVERGHGQRGSGRDSGGGTEEIGHEEEEGKEKGCRQVGSSWGMTEKEGMTEKRRND